MSEVVLVKPPLLDIPDILTSSDKLSHYKPWALQKKSVINPDVSDCWPGDNLSLGYLSSYLRARGVSTRMVDAYIQDLSLNEIVNIIIFEQPRLLGISVLDSEAKTAFKLVKMVRQEGYHGHITLGGYFPSFCPEYVLDNNCGIDSIVIGEGEITLWETYQSLVNDGDFEKITGIVYRLGSVISDYHPRTTVDIDLLPFPDRDLHAVAVTKGYVYSLSASRGCDWAKCSFCCIHPFAKRSYTKSWRGRSIDNVIEELQLLASTHSGKLKVNFTDENFLPSGKESIRSTEFADKMRASGIEMEYLISTRVASVNRSVFQKLYSVGLRKVFLGVESGVSRILKIYDKGHSPEAGLKALKILTDIGIVPFAGTIMFDPFSDFDELVANYEYFKQVEHVVDYFDLFRYSRRLQIYSGSPLRQKLIAEGVFNVNEPLFNQYSYSDVRIQKVYNSIIKIQEEIYPTYEEIGTIWQIKNAERAKQMESEFASVFHQFMHFCISLSNTAKDSKPVSTSNFVKQIKKIR